MSSDGGCERSDCEAAVLHEYVGGGTRNSSGFLKEKIVLNIMNVSYYNPKSDLISLIPMGIRVAAIGVFMGDFSQEILQKCRPSELILIDLCADGPIDFGDADSKNSRIYDGKDLEKGVRTRFHNNPEVKIKKGCSSQIGAFPADYFDAVYVDGDHSHRGVMRDFINSWRCLKHGGWLMRHDFEANSQKTNVPLHFGVKHSVEEFCWQYGESI